jgi:hypothetical protein
MAKIKSGKKQSDLPGIKGPGVSRVSIAEVDELAEKYIRERDKRCAMTPKEIAAKSELVDALHRHAKEIGKNSDGEIRYMYDNVVVLLKPGKETLKVKEVEAFEEDDVT